MLNEVKLKCPRNQYEIMDFRKFEIKGEVCSFGKEGNDS